MGETAAANDNEKAYPNSVRCTIEGAKPGLDPTSSYDTQTIKQIVDFLDSVRENYQPVEYSDNKNFNGDYVKYTYKIGSETYVLFVGGIGNGEYNFSVRQTGKQQEQYLLSDADFKTIYNDYRFHK